MSVKKFLIESENTFRDALQVIEKNHHGFVCIADTKGRVKGILTDGDIRRSLLDGSKLDNKIKEDFNSNFIFESISSPRELILKKLDQAIKVIPILDEEGRLCEIVTRDSFLINKEENVIARSKAPVRITFGGGGSDLTHFFSNDVGAVLNATISLYAHATLRQRSDTTIIINSFDLSQTIKAPNLNKFLSMANDDFDLIRSLIAVIKPSFGFQLDINCDFIGGSGLGGSSAICVAILGCFNIFRTDKLSKKEIAELAFQSERLHLGISGGWQDQYAASFGGFNFIEFTMDGNIIHPLQLESSIISELEENLIIVDTGILHNSGDIHKDQKIEMQAENIKEIARKNVQLSYQMRNQLLDGDLLKLGSSLAKAWEYKKQFSKKISNSDIDKIYNSALKAGAIGGKLMGAGSGGHIIFYVPSPRKFDVLNFLSKQKLRVFTFNFEKNGLQSWAVRDKK